MLLCVGHNFSEFSVRYFLLIQEEPAKNFLRSTALSVSEVGYRLGYAEPAAFSRAFTQWTGVSPLKWRKNAN